MRVINEAMALGLCTTLDHGIYELYIRTWQACRELERECGRLGHYTQTANGSWKTAPWSTALTRYAALLRSVMADIGLTPASRSRVTAVATEPEPAAELLSFDGGKK
jgi:P27 family predicted phage terminase small subunit